MCKELYRLYSHRPSLHDHSSNFIIFSSVFQVYTVIVNVIREIGRLSGLTLFLLGNFSCFCCRLLTIFNINFFKKFFH